MKLELKFYKKFLVKTNKTCNMKSKMDLAYEILKLPLSKECMPILAYLSDGRERSITEMYIDLNTAQPSVSRVIGKLRRANYVKWRREGAYKLYSLNEDMINKVNRVCKSLNTSTTR